MKDELDVKIMTEFEFAALRLKTYSYLTHDDNENKKRVRHKNVCHKTKTYKNCSAAAQLEKT